MFYLKFRYTITTLFFILVCLSTQGQRNNDVPVYRIDSSNDVYYYKKATILLEVNNSDSLFEAYRIFKKLNYFDSVKYSKDHLKQDYLKIEKINLDNIKTAIIGKWNFEWSGSNWGMSETYKTRNEQVVFTESDVSFFHKDSLVRKTAYLITNEFTPVLKEFTFQIYFQDDKTKNNISFKSRGADYIAHLKFNEHNTGLYLDAPGFCNDCGYRIYMKQSAENYRME